MRPKDETSNQFTKYRDMVHGYYNKEFKGFQEVVNQGVRTDPTIMLLGYKKPNRLTNLSQVALCTKGPEGNNRCCNLSPSLVSQTRSCFHYLACGIRCRRAPQWLGSWRRQGFASFMLVHIIKFCASRRPEKVVIRIQSSRTQSMENLSLSSFSVVNKDTKDDGIGKLREELLFSFSQENDLAFHHFDGTPDPDNLEEVALCLMMLPPGALKVCQTLIVNKDKDNKTSSLFDMEKNTWCRFPMYLPTIPQSQTILSCTEMDQTIFEELHLLKKLCPPCQTRKLPLLPPKKMYVQGGMMLDMRIQQTKQKYGNALAANIQP